MFDVAETVGRSHSAEGERLYWFLGVAPSGALWGWFDDAVEALVSLAKGRGLCEKTLRAALKRPNKATHRVYGVQARLCAETTGEVTIQFTIHWADRTSKGKERPVAWA